MLKLIHSADFHLDAPFSSLPPDLARQRRAEQRTLLTRLSQLVQTENADLVLLSGDLLDSSQTYQETVQALSRTLAEIHVPVFMRTPAPFTPEPTGPTMYIFFPPSLWNPLSSHSSIVSSTERPLPPPMPTVPPSWASPPPKTETPT